MGEPCPDGGIRLAPVPTGGPASVPAFSAEPVPADLRWGRDLPGGPPPLVGGQPAAPEPDALPRPRDDAPALQGKGLRVPPGAPPARRVSVRLRVDGRARGRL